jgi:hypothetical protein
MRTKPSYGAVSSAKLGSTVACTPETVPSGVSGARFGRDYCDRTKTGVCGGRCGFD